MTTQFNYCSRCKQIIPDPKENTCKECVKLKDTKAWKKFWKEKK